MWTNASGKNKVMGWCRNCSYVWLPDTNKPISPEEFEKWRKEQLQRETTRKLEAEKAIKLLESDCLWEKFHHELAKNPLGLQTMESWGIPQSYAEYWKLGFIQDYTVHAKDGEYHRPAISIPVWQKDGKISNIKVRILEPKTSADRYRNWYKIGTAKPFVAWRNSPYDNCLLVEGEKKAMVSALHCRMEKIGIQVIGIPSKTPDEDAIKQFDGYKNIYVCLDPDAEVAEKGISALQRIINMLGRERLNLIKLPAKIDDMLIHNNLKMDGVLRYSKRLERK
jgi:hypothetical protein